MILVQPNSGLPRQKIRKIQAEPEHLIGPTQHAETPFFPRSRPKFWVWPILEIQGISSRDRVSGAFIFGWKMKREERKGGKLNKKVSIWMWRLLLIIVLVAILFAAIVKDRFGLTTMDHIKDSMTRGDWVGWIHPLGTEVDRTIDVGPFDSFIECDEHSRAHIERYFEAWDKSRFYCGYSCSDTDPDQREKNCKLVR